ncbi:MAG: helicase-associated domain-containing protein [Spirochaetaceae bacterium]|jgi:hypothetical protein|nr:helicase-associated domain-containing protein [Spirochaetaceae bacterium]
MKHPFRSLAAWREDLLTLPDTALFELLRTVFGNIKTPFNKHRLMEELASFLSRPDVLETIALFIGGEDHKIIAAVAALENPAAGELESFFAGEFSYVELQGILLNLEERLILYRYRDEGVFRLALNPLLEPVLAPYAADLSPLFPSTEAEEIPAEELDDRILVSIIAFAVSEDDFFRAESRAETRTDWTLRKKAADEAARIFPGLDFGRLLSGFLGAELLEPEGPRLAVDRRRLEYFGKLEARDRLFYLAAGIYLNRAAPDASGGDAYLRRGRFHTLARFFRRFHDALAEGRRYNRKTLLRVAWIAAREIDGSWAERGAGAFTLDAGEMTRYLEPLVTVGLLHPAESGEYTVPAAPRKHPDTSFVVTPDTAAPGTAAPGTATPDTASDPRVSQDTPFSFVLYPGISWEDADLLAAFAVPRECGAVVRLEITRESAARGFDAGFKAEDMLELLERLSGFPADQNLRWTIGDWGERYTAVALYRGAALTLAEDRRYLATGGPLSRFIRRTLAPGVYLLAEGDLEEVEAVLARSGVDIIAWPDTGSGKESLFRSPYPSLPPGRRAGTPSGGNPPAAALVESGGAALPAGEDGAEDGGRTARAGERKERFRKALAAARLPPAVQAELSARIERRLIISEIQLRDAAVKQEKLEARNLDYPGKAVIARQALARKSLLEVVYPAAGGEQRVFGIPLALEKSGGESVLVLRSLSRPEDAPESGTEEVRIPLGKISLIRRIKQSLFEG